MRIRLSAALIAILLLSSLITVANSLQKSYAGTFPGSNGKIAFERYDAYGNAYGNGQGAFYVMNADGSGQTFLANGYAPSWSPDGTKIAFSRVDRESDYERSNYEVYVMNADGTNQTNLTNNPAYDEFPSWSPDGTKIAFQRNDEIYVMNADGSGQTALTSNGHYPSWSPDGTKIAFVSWISGISEIHVMNADGTGQTNLSNGLWETSPSWSPDGTKIAYSRGDIYVMNADGSGKTNLTNHKWDDSDPSWSPDGTKIAFTTNRNSDTHYAYQIYVMNVDGTGQTNLSNNAVSDRMPDWQTLPFSPPPPASENRLTAADSIVGLGETVTLIQEIDAAGSDTGTLLSLKVTEPDGDLCEAQGLPQDIPAAGRISKEYPTNFVFDTAGGDGICNTMKTGTYKAVSTVEVNGSVSSSETEFQTDFFVVPESPIGAAALMASSLAALGAFVWSRSYRKKAN